MSAKCPVCGSPATAELVLYIPWTIPFQRFQGVCTDRMCGCAGKLCGSEEEALATFSSMLSIPEPLRELVRRAREWQMVAEFPSDSKAVLALDAAAESLPAEILTACGVVERRNG